MSWENRVAFSREGVAHVPHQILILGRLSPEDIAWLESRFDLYLEGEEPDQQQEEKVAVRKFTLRNDLEVIRVVRELKVNGFRAQPNHVLFADPCTCCPPHPAVLYPHGVCAGPGGANPVWANPAWANPVWANPVWANPVWANPVWANPARANPAWANPVWANPVWANPAWANPAWANAACANPVWANPVWASAGDLESFLLTGERRSTASPAERPAGWPEAGEGEGEGGPRIVVLDTGYARPVTEEHPGNIRPEVVPTGLTDVPVDQWDAPDVNPLNDLLDPVAGHGTFIAGIIDHVQPGCEIEVRKVVQPEGDADEDTLRQALKDLLPNPPQLLNLSLSGYAFDDMEALRVAVEDLQEAGTVIVASAGNDGICRETSPAAFPGVVSVGAIGPDGPAPFSNYGHWVRACAPGVDVVSTFFEFNGDEQAIGTEPDPDNFTQWARWSGTSFSAPLVVGALAQAMVTHGITVDEAVERVIDAPDLMRIPNLGTVVNVD